MAKHMAPSPKHEDEFASTGTTTARRFASEPRQPDPEPMRPEYGQPEYGQPEQPESDSKKPKRSNLLSNILIVVGVALLVVAGVIYFNNNRNYEKIDEENERVAEYARLSDDSNTPPQVDWESLRAMNPDIVGWLQVPGTVVNYPVFQSGDNDYYLHHAPDQSDSIGGSVFLDCENTSPGMLDNQTIVYGHHMRNGSQFKQIADMDNQELFDGVDTVWYVTEQAVYELAPLFVYYTDENDTNVRQFEFESADAFRLYMNGYLSNAVAQRANAAETLAVIDRVFTLSTCNYYDGYGRTLLVCALKTDIPGTPQYEAEQARLAQAATQQPMAEAQPAIEAQPVGEY